MKNFVLIFLSVLLLISCEEEETKEKYVFSIILKNNYHPAYKAVIKGATDAAKKYSELNNAEIIIDKQYPVTEDSTGMANLLLGLVNSASMNLVHGISLTCINSTKLNNIINQGALNGVKIITFESDAPNSLRYAYFGPNQDSVGRKLADLITLELNNVGNIAIISGRENSISQQERLAGIIDELKNGQIKIINNGIIFTDETINSTKSALNELYNNHPEIDGVIFTTSGMFLAQNAIPWTPGKIKIVATDGYPEQFDYLSAGYMNSIIGFNYYNYGYNTIEALIQLEINNIEPNDKNYDTYSIINQTNLVDWQENWNLWLK